MTDDGRRSQPRAKKRAAGELHALYERQVRERGFRSDAAQRAAVDALEDVRSRLLKANHSGRTRLLSKIRLARTPHAERGLYLWGGVGRGKTWLMDLFFQSLPFPEKRRRHFHRFMYDVHAQLKTLKDQQEPLETVAETIAAETRVICFDEFFVSDIADAMILGTLFESLFRRGVTLVATSNVPPKDLYKDGLQRARFLPAIALLEQNTLVLAVDGGVDYRLRQLTQAGTYLLSSAPDTPRRLEDLFDDLADEDDSSVARHEPSASSAAHADRSASPGALADAGPPDAPHPRATSTVEIEGRPIPVLREDENAIWFDFEAICEGPRGTSDYIQIAREYQTVFVTNVPRFTSQRENAARRFIALVDELYDHNVNLILSAAAPPDDLYHGERLKFEFQRTISRLIEMQTEEYLAREHRA